MKKLICALLISSLATPALAVDGDHLAHFSSSTLYGVVSDTVLYHTVESLGTAGRAGAAFGIALIPGIAWEIKDEFERDNRFGFDDLAADALGALTGVVAAELFNGQFWISASGHQIRLVGKW